MPLSSVLGAQSLVRPGVCTSSTRPASPFEGQVIYETDTDKVLVYDGTSWLPPENTAWGAVGRAQKTTDTSVTTTIADITGLSITWTAQSDRLYKISFHCIALVGTADAYISVTVADSSNNRLTLFRGGNSPTTGRFSVTGFLYETGLSGSVTRKARVECNTGTATLEGAAGYPTQFVIEDIGPA